MSPKYFTRRQALKALALTIGLPLLESVTPLGLLSKTAFGAPARRKRFIGCFFGSGCYMPNNQNGDWGFNGGALSPLEAAGHRNNTLILRGYRSIDNYDPHWSSTAGFLSCNEIQPLSADNVAFASRGVGVGCGKTFDQYVADARNTSQRSISVAWEDQNFHDSGQAREFGMTYVNALSWRTDNIANGNVIDPMAAFSRLFAGSTNQSAVELQQKIRRQLSVLDGYKKQYGSFAKILSAADQRALGDSLDSFREMERNLTALETADTSCQLNYPNIDGSLYDRNFKAYNRIIVRALQCDTIATATIMFHNGIGDNRALDNLGSLHGCAHHFNDPGTIERTKAYTRIYTSILADLVTQLKNAGLLSDTLILVGSNMSDGNLHGNANIPLILLGEGNDIKFGQEITPPGDITNASNNRQLADLYMDLSKVYGLNLNSFGEQNSKSTGASSEIFT